MWYVTSLTSGTNKRLVAYGRVLAGTPAVLKHNYSPSCYCLARMVWEQIFIAHNCVKSHILLITP